MRQNHQKIYWNQFEKKLKSSHLEVFCKKDVLKNFAKFTGKHVYWSIWLNKIADLRLYAKRGYGTGVFLRILGKLKKNYFLEHLRPPASGNDEHQQVINFIRRPGSDHCVKSVQIWSNFWSVFSRRRTEYGKILRVSPYSIRKRENTDQKLLRIWTLFTQWHKYSHFKMSTY